MLHRMVLTARSKVEMGPGALKGDFGSIMACCMQSSIASSLTGALVVESGLLLEILEGDSAELCDFHSRAEQDPRVADIQVLEFVPVLRRAYETWAVAAASPETADPALTGAIAEKRAGPFAVSQHIRRVLMHGVLAETPPLCVAAQASAGAYWSSVGVSSTSVPVTASDAGAVTGGCSAAMTPRARPPERELTPVVAPKRTMTSSCSGRT